MLHYLLVRYLSIPWLRHVIGYSILFVDVNVGHRPTSHMFNYWTISRDSAGSSKELWTNSISHHRTEVRNSAELLEKDLGPCQRINFNRGDNSVILELHPRPIPCTSFPPEYSLCHKAAIDQPPTTRGGISASPVVYSRKYDKTGHFRITLAYHRLLSPSPFRLLHCFDRPYLMTFRKVCVCSCNHRCSTGRISWYWLCCPRRETIPSPW